MTLEKNELCWYEMVTVGVVLHGKNKLQNIILCDLTFSKMHTFQIVNSVTSVDRIAGRRGWMR